jgi:hypothetical protein
MFLISQVHYSTILTKICYEGVPAAAAANLIIEWENTCDVYSSTSHLQAEYQFSLKHMRSM